MFFEIEQFRECGHFNDAKPSNYYTYQLANENRCASPFKQQTGNSSGKCMSSIDKATEYVGEKKIM